MRRHAPLLLGLILAAAAIFIHLPSMTSVVTPFSRDSFAVLPGAETALQSGKRDQALAAFRAAYARAIFEGLPGIAERVRLRTGLAGVKLLDGRAGEAWPFLEAFALLSDDFNRDAGEVESAYLSRPALHQTRFEYHLTRPDGSTFWTRQPDLDWTGLWPFWVAWNDTTTKPLVSGIFLDKGAPWPSASYALVVLLDLSNKMPMPIQADITAPNASTRAQALYSPPSPFGKAEVVAPGRWVVNGLLAKRGASLTRVILFTDALPDPGSVSITLLRDYRPL